MEGTFGTFWGSDSKVNTVNLEPFNNKHRHYSGPQWYVVFTVIRQNMKNNKRKGNRWGQIQIYSLELVADSQKGAVQVFQSELLHVILCALVSQPGTRWQLLITDLRLSHDCPQNSRGHWVQHILMYRHWGTGGEYRRKGTNEE